MRLARSQCFLLAYFLPHVQFYHILSAVTGWALGVQDYRTPQESGPFQGVLGLEVLMDFLSE